MQEQQFPRFARVPCSHTKKGPGRTHTSGVVFMLQVDATSKPVFLKRPPQRKLPVAVHGVPGFYMTYAEHDRCVRESMGRTSKKLRQSVYAFEATLIEAENRNRRERQAEAA